MKLQRSMGITLSSFREEERKNRRVMRRSRRINLKTYLQHFEIHICGVKKINHNWAVQKETNDELWIQHFWIEIELLFYNGLDVWHQWKTGMCVPQFMTWEPAMKAETSNIWKKRIVLKCYYLCFMHQVLHLKNTNLNIYTKCHLPLWNASAKFQGRELQSYSVLDTSRLLSKWQLTQNKIRARSGPDSEKCSTVPYLDISFRVQVVYQKRCHSTLAITQIQF